MLQKFDGKPVSCYAVAAENRSQKRSDLMIKAAIFDLDGTIGDTVESIAYSGNRALRDIGYQAFPVENGVQVKEVIFLLKIINIMQVMA